MSIKETILLMQTDLNVRFFTLKQKLALAIQEKKPKEDIDHLAKTIDEIEADRFGLHVGILKAIGYLMCPGCKSNTRSPCNICAQCQREVCKDCLKWHIEDSKLSLFCFLCYNKLPSLSIKN
jgi:hypothetical protein